jgi:hypothetical protein
MKNERHIIVIAQENRRVSIPIIAWGLKVEDVVLC